MSLHRLGSSAASCDGHEVSVTLSSAQVADPRLRRYARARPYVCAPIEGER